MNKLVIFLLFSFVIIGINSVCETDGAVSGPEECWLRRLSGDQTHCCYVEEDTETPCWSLSDDEYENIKKYKDYAENLYAMEEITIDCSAKILTYAFSILAIFALLL